MKAEDVRTTAILGAGTMGAGIGLCLAGAGLEVRLFDVKSEQLKGALMRIENCQAVLVQEGVVSAEAAQEARGRVAVTTELKKALSEVDFVLEAAPEDLTLKKELFREVESLTPSETILATNTSGLSITDIASACRRPERVGGMHWINPPELVPLVEVIRGRRTAPETVDLIYALAKRVGKRPVVIQQDVPGFCLNRLQFAVFREALHLIESGVVTPEDVDQTMRCGLGFRYPWLGPLKTADLGGLDVFLSVAGYLFKDLNASQTPPRSLADLVAQGKLGLKSGQGFYEYGAGQRNMILRQRDVAFIRQWRMMLAIDPTLGSLNGPKGQD